MVRSAARGRDSSSIARFSLQLKRTRIGVGAKASPTDILLAGPGANRTINKGIILGNIMLLERAERIVEIGGLARNSWLTAVRSKSIIARTILTDTLWPGVGGTIDDKAVWGSIRVPGSEGRDSPAQTFGTNIWLLGEARKGIHVGVAPRNAMLARTLGRPGSAKMASGIHRSVMSRGARLLGRGGNIDNRAISGYVPRLGRVEKGGRVGISGCSNTRLLNGRDDSIGVRVMLRVSQLPSRRSAIVGKAGSGNVLLWNMMGISSRVGTFINDTWLDIAAGRGDNSDAVLRRSLVSGRNRATGDQIRSLPKLQLGRGDAPRAWPEIMLLCASIVIENRLGRGDGLSVDRESLLSMSGNSRATADNAFLDNSRAGKGRDMRALPRGI